MQPSVLAAALVTSVGCTTMLPPPAPPAQVLSGPVPIAPPAPPGEGNVVIDADAPAHVAQVTGVLVGVARGGAMVAEELRPLCDTTPCVVHLPIGAHDLVFSAAAGPGGGHGTVAVGAAPSVYRYALGNTHPDRSGEAVSAIFGIGGLVALGAAAGLLDSDPSTARGLAIGGLGALCVGLVMAAVGHTAQNGTGVQWPAR
jgi:hypothetical protein